MTSGGRQTSQNDMATFRFTFEHLYMFILPPVKAHNGQNLM